METSPLATIAAFGGILGSAYTAGATAGLSTMAVPGMLSAKVPAHVLAKQWEGIYTIGKALGPRTALISLAGYGYLAYDRSSRGQEWVSTLAAGVLTIGIVPYTLLLMAPTNSLLLEAASGTASSLSEAAVRELVLKWKGLNLVRALLPLCGSAIGLWGLLH